MAVIRRPKKVSDEDLLPKQNTPQGQQSPQEQQPPQQDDPSGMNQIMQDRMQQQADMQKLEHMKQLKDNSDHDPKYAEKRGQGKKVTDDTIAQAYKTFTEYKDAKTDLTQNIIDNEAIFELCGWASRGRTSGAAFKAKSSWLLNMIQNKHADCMDNYPSPNILPREAGDVQTAEMLSSVIPVILEQNDYEGTYSDAAWDLVKQGGQVQGVFWDTDRDNGLGNVTVRRIEPLDIFWQPNISDIQDSANVFLVTMIDVDELKARHPDIEFGNGGMRETEDYYNANETEKNKQIPIFDWYYKRRVSGTDEMGIPYTKTYLHYAKFAAGKLIYASENDPQYADRGWYDHGLYPFVFCPLVPVSRSIWGMGFIDIAKYDQAFIDQLRTAILKNAMVNARPRYAVRDDAGLNEDEFTDPNVDIIHFHGNLGEDSFRQIVPTQMSNIYETIYLDQVNQMKETSGNTNTAQGQASQVTAASGIAQLIEQAGKIARDMNSASYRAFSQVVYMVIELIRQFYDEPRCFRITGENGYRFENVDNSGLVPQQQETIGDTEFSTRLPIMDIEVKPQKRSAYTIESQNQTMMNLYGQGFFAPGNADAALACLEGMEFEGIDDVKARIQNNGTMYQQMMQMQQQMLQMQQMLTGQVQQMPAQTQQPTGQVKQSSGSQAAKAAAQSRESTQPRT